MKKRKKSVANNPKILFRFRNYLKVQPALTWPSSCNSARRLQNMRPMGRSKGTKKTVKNALSFEDEDGGPKKRQKRLEPPPPPPPLTRPAETSPMPASCMIGWPFCNSSRPQQSENIETQIVPKRNPISPSISSSNGDTFEAALSTVASPVRSPVRSGVPPATSPVLQRTKSSPTKSPAVKTPKSSHTPQEKQQPQPQISSTTIWLVLLVAAVSASVLLMRLQLTSEAANALVLSDFLCLRDEVACNHFMRGVDITKRQQLVVSLFASDASREKVAAAKTWIMNGCSLAWVGSLGALASLVWGVVAHVVVALFKQKDQKPQPLLRGLHMPFLALLLTGLACTQYGVYQSPGPWAVSKRACMAGGAVAAAYAAALLAAASD